MFIQVSLTKVQLDRPSSLPAVKGWRKRGGGPWGDRDSEGESEARH